MRLLCIALVSLGALVMLYSIITFCRALSRMKKQMNDHRLFGEKIYAACLIMMLFFLIGYIVCLAATIREPEATANSLLISLIFFFGAIFVYAMVTMMQRMFASITEKEKLRREKELAEHGSQMKGDFLSRMSHEMRTPMNAITGMANIGKNAPDLSRKDYCFGVIEDASKHLLGVINDVLDMSKIEASKLTLSPDIFDFRKMIDSVAAIITPQTEAKDQQLRMAIDEDVPMAVRADEQRLRQVIVNLLGNAVKFTPASGVVSLFVRVLSAENGRILIQFEVKDTGIGMSKQQQEKLFMPFEQADDSISRKYGGTGLGLSISNHIVEMMGSAIRVESEIGQGASFLFDLYVDVPPPNEVTTLAQEGAGKTGFANYDFTGKQVLIAEDIEINREIISVLLEDTHIGIDCAENGREVCRKMLKAPEKYDVIFMDLQMPEMDGLEAARTIRSMENEHCRTIPIIAMTANAFKEDMYKCLEAGMNDHIAKPIDPQMVLAKLAQYLLG